MNIEVKNNWMIGKAMVLKRVAGKIVLVEDPTKKVTRHYLIEEVSENAQKAGYKKGDIIVAKMGWDLKFPGHFMVAIDPAEVVLIDRRYGLKDFFLLDEQGNPIPTEEVAA